MADSPDVVVIVGLSTGPIYGCPDTLYGAGKSFENSRSGETTELKSGETSEVIAAAFHTTKETTSYSAKIKGTVPTDKRGTALKVGDKTGFLDKITVSKQEGDFAEIKIEMVSWPGVVATVAG